MKKILVILACVATLFSFASCDNGSGSAVATSNEALAGAIVTQLKTSIEGIPASISAADATTNGTDTATYVVNVPVDGTSAQFTVLGGELTYTFTKATGEKATNDITGATVNGSIKVARQGDYQEYTLALNGAVKAVGTLEITEASKDGKTPASVKTLTVSSIAYSDAMGISVNGAGVNAEVVFDLAQMKTSEDAQADAEKAAKAFVASLIEKFESGALTSAEEGKKITVTLSDVTGADGNVVVTIPVTKIAEEETAASSGKYAVTTGTVEVTATAASPYSGAVTFTGVTLVGGIVADNATAASASFSAADAEAGVSLAVTSVVYGGYNVTIADAE